MRNFVEFATGWRIDDPVRVGFKMLVCGNCIEESMAVDPTKMSGHFPCEKCKGSFGEHEAFERSDRLLANICEVAARKRELRLKAKPASPECGVQ